MSYFEVPVYICHLTDVECRKNPTVLMDRDEELTLFTEGMTRNRIQVVVCKELNCSLLNNLHKILLI